MPGRDGTGPMGVGATGRGLGPCRTTAVNRGQGYGCGMGLGRGAGLGRGQGFRANGANLNQPAQDEVTILRNQAQNLQQNLEAVNKRLEEIDK